MITNFEKLLAYQNHRVSLATKFRVRTLGEGPNGMLRYILIPSSCRGQVRVIMAYDR